MSSTLVWWHVSENTVSFILPNNVVWRGFYFADVIVPLVIVALNYRLSTYVGVISI